MIKLLRVIGLLEGLSYLGLFGITMPLKYLADNPTPNKILGNIHGILFIVYILLVVACARQFKWSAKETIASFIASVLPFGTFIADVKIFKRYQQPENKA